MRGWGEEGQGLGALGVAGVGVASWDQHGSGGGWWPQVPAGPLAAPQGAEELRAAGAGAACS